MLQILLQVDYETDPLVEEFEVFHICWWVMRIAVVSQRWILVERNYDVSLSLLEKPEHKPNLAERIVPVKWGAGTGLSRISKFLESKEISIW